MGVRHAYKKRQRAKHKSDADAAYSSILAEMPKLSLEDARSSLTPEAYTLAVPAANPASDGTVDDDIVDAEGAEGAETPRDWTDHDWDGKYRGDSSIIQGLPPICQIYTYFRLQYTCYWVFWSKHSATPFVSTLIMADV